MIRSKIIIALIIGMASLTVMGARDKFRAFVDKNEIEADEPIILTLEYQGQTTEEPNLSRLEQDFIIDFRQQSTNTKFINGNFSATTSWILHIYPKTSGPRIVIPAVTFGSESSSPITIIQSESAAKKIDGIKIEALVDKNEVYINAELILTIEIKTALPIRNGTLTKLDLKNAIIETLEEDSDEIIEQGIKYHIVRQRYAIFPSTTGSLKIPPFLFRGMMPNKNMGHQMWPAFFDRGKQISARSQELIISVKDIPLSFPKDQVFLPMKNFMIAESINKSDQEFFINKAITRRFELKAKGTLASFLPNLAPAKIDKLQVYTEDGEKKQNVAPDGIEAISEFSHVYMPNATGEIIIPEQIVYWWNTEEDELRTTSIREFKFNVTGDESLASTAQETVLEENLAPTPLTPKKEKWDRPWWIWASIPVILAVLIFGILFIKRRRAWQNSSRELLEDEKLYALINEIKILCAAKDAKLAYKKLNFLRASAIKNPQLNLWDDDIEMAFTNFEQSLFDKDSSLSVDDHLDKIRRHLKSKKRITKLPFSLAPLYPN